MKNIVYLFLLTSTFAFSQPPHTNAHAHNDYEHDNPLFDALRNRFASVEADVHLFEDKLLVSHNDPGQDAKTLEALYLKPLDSIRRRNGGFIFAPDTTPLTLLIDIKTSGEPTFKALTRLLLKYNECIDRPSQKGAVQIIISGNRPIEMIRQDSNHLSSIDGRPEDLGKGFSWQEMPWISESYTKIIQWDGQGAPTLQQLNTLKSLAARVHAENKRLRLWGIPDNANTWKVLLSAGIDVINTDKLKELHQYLTKIK